jgi:hypothetical protein
MLRPSATTVGVAVQRCAGLLFLWSDGRFAALIAVVTLQLHGGRT